MARFLQWLGAALGLSLSFGIGMGAGCSAGGNRTTGGAGAGGDDGTGGNGNNASSSGNPSSGSGGSGGFNMGDAGLPACATFSAKAAQAPAAMLIALDGSASMNNSSKWSSAQLAIVNAIDKDIFDTMSLGLLAFPRTYVNPPPCICNFIGFDQQSCNQVFAPGVSCGVQPLPQVPVAAAGTEKTNAPMGVRRQIYDWLVNNMPLSNQDDGSPVYMALKSGFDVLKLQNIDRRILLLITDGGFSCASMGFVGKAFNDGYMCPDWQHPDDVNDLITQARTDATKPINTFVVGVPGSNSTGQKDGAFDTPPYNMLLALSTYAVSGSPDTVDPSCTKDAVFSQGGAAPAKPCHIDLSTGAFDANVLSDAISKIRGAALGCVYDLPTPPMGQTIDKATVNVNVTIDGVTITLPKRKDPLDLCAVDGCWDYTPDDKVRIYGKTCDDLSNAKAGKVDIYVGCETILK